MIDLHEPDIPEPVSLGIPEPVSMGIPGPVSVGIPGPVSVGIPEAVPAGFSGPVTMQVPTIMLNDGIGKCNVLFEVKILRVYWSNIFFYKKNSLFPHTSELLLQTLFRVSLYVTGYGKTDHFAHNMIFQ